MRFAEFAYNEKARIAKVIEDDKNLAAMKKSVAESEQLLDSYKKWVTRKEMEKIGNVIKKAVAKYT